MRSLLIALLALTLLACEMPQATPTLFRTGEIVCIKLTSERVMITAAYSGHPTTYYVRIQSAVTGKNSLPRSYPEVAFREFELERCR